jgi:hypothetical protein
MLGITDDDAAAEDAIDRAIAAMSPEFDALLTRVHIAMVMLRNRRFRQRPGPCALIGVCEMLVARHTDADADAGDTALPPAWPFERANAADARLRRIDAVVLDAVEHIAKGGDIAGLAADLGVLFDAPTDVPTAVARLHAQIDDCLREIAADCRAALADYASAQYYTPGDA